MTTSVTVADGAEELGSAAVLLSRFIRAMAHDTAAAIGFGWVATPGAPSNYPALRAAYKRSEQTRCPLPVSSLHCDAVIYQQPQDNHKLRFWHDTLHVQTGLCFSVADELELGLHHLRIAERKGLAKGSLPWQLLRVDLLGQNYLMAIANRFPADQRTFTKRCIRYGLDEAMAMELRELREGIQATYAQTEGALSMARIRAYLITVIIFAVAVHLVWDAVSPLIPYVIGGLIALTALGFLYYRRRW